MWRMKIQINQPLQQDLIRVAHLLADEARAVILPFFRSSTLSSDNKDAAGGFDPVTQADRAAETAMRDILARERPNDGVLGEEFGVTQGTSGLTWVLDPIDGTRGFICGTPTWGVLIAVSDASGPLFGVIDQPYTAERFVGGFGQASLAGPHSDTSLATRAARPLAQATIMTTFPEVGTLIEGRAFHALSAATQLTRYGMDCYAYALLALGQIDLVVEAGLNPYDIHAPIAVVQAAGGIVSNWQGGAAHTGGRIIAAANADIHAAALDVLNGALND
jgi:histidinol phosphatase-like enzyme (inositol monophosphatase family)